MQEKPMSQAIIGCGANIPDKTEGKDFEMNEMLTAQLPEIITAHAGFAAAGGPDDKSEDNTLDNIIKAIGFGPAVMEVDTRLITKPDGTACLVLDHDGDKDDGHCPTLQEMFELLMGRHPRSAELGEHGMKVRIQVDEKTDGILEYVLSLAEQVGFPWERLICAGDSTYDYVKTQLPRLREVTAQGMEFWMNPGEISSYEEMVQDTPRFIQRIEALGLPRFVVNSNYIVFEDGRLLKEFKAHGIRVSAGTLNSREALEQYLPMGFYNVTTRLPEALTLRRELQNRATQ